MQSRADMAVESECFDPSDILENRSMPDIETILRMQIKIQSFIPKMDKQQSSVKTSGLLPLEDLFVDRTTC